MPVVTEVSIPSDSPAKKNGLSLYIYMYFVVYINFGHIHNVVVEIISTLLQKLAIFAKKNKKLHTENRALQEVVHMQNNIEQEHQSAVYSLEYKIKELVARNVELERLEEQHDRNIRLLHQKNKELQKALSQMGCVRYE